MLRAENFSDRVDSAAEKPRRWSTTDDSALAGGGKWVGFGSFLLFFFRLLCSRSGVHSRHLECTRPPRRPPTRRQESPREKRPVTSMAERLTLPLLSPINTRFRTFFAQMPMLRPLNRLKRPRPFRLRFIPILTGSPLDGVAGPDRISPNGPIVPCHEKTRRSDNSHYRWRCCTEIPANRPNELI